MKRITIVLLFISSLCSAQEFKEFFLGEDYLKYKGALLKIDTVKHNDILSNFYQNLVYCTPYNSNVIYPDKKYHFKTAVDSLKNRTFKVIDIVIKTGESIEKYDFFKEPIFVLEDISNHQKIYYLYNKDYESDFPFLTTPIHIDRDAVCTELERSTDDFTGDIRINTPMSFSKSFSTIYIYKDIRKGKPSYTLSLHNVDSYLSVNGTEVIVLFTDNTKWTRQVKIDVDADKDGYDYSAYIKLSAADLELFSRKTIKKYRLHIFDETVNSYQAEKLKVYFNCIKSVK